MAVDKEHDMKVDLFGDYAETDLDQPTDYSLRYAEDDTDDDEKQSREYFSGSVQEDTVKTYYTEGTPYETPFNFSTATSMSDLRLEDAKETVDPPKKHTKKSHDIGRKESLPLLVGKEAEPPKSSQPPDSDDRLTPDKMLDYYEARISDGFSRANSLCSLGSAITKRNNVTEIGSKVPSVDSSTKDSESERAESNTSSSNVVVLRLPGETESPSEGKNNSRVMDKEGKMVTFSRHDYYAEQTPLMFSRCSSLGSLSGFEQHSIHDDRSSIVSDFSRRTSGIISPSELPDSPTQTIPPSPRNHKSSDFASKIQEEAVRPSVRHLSYTKSHATRSSVFEDDIATFKEESTPIEFSTATSLSSLTIDDEPKIRNNTKEERELVESNPTCDLSKDVKREAPAEKVNNVEIEKDQEQVSDGDEDDEDMLAACISMGMQNNRYRQSFKMPTVQKPMPLEPTNVSVRYQRTSSLNRLDPRVPVPSADVSGASTKTTKNAIEVVVAPDTVHVYCTNNTKEQRELLESNRTCDLSKYVKETAPVERTNNVEIERDQEQVSDGDEDDEDMLAACISMGMQNNRYRQSFKTATVQKPMPSVPTNVSVRYQRTTSLNRLEPRVPVTSVDAPVASTKTTRNAIEVVVAPDTVHVYCTNNSKEQRELAESNRSCDLSRDVKRDAPAERANNAEIGMERDQEQLSDGDEDDEDILAACISMGMQNNRYRQSFKTSTVQNATTNFHECVHQCLRSRRMFLCVIRELRL